MALIPDSAPSPLARILLGALILLLGSGLAGCGGDPEEAGDRREPSSSEGGDEAGSPDGGDKQTGSSDASDPRPVPPPTPDPTLGGDAAPADGLQGRVVRSDGGAMDGIVVQLREGDKTVAAAKCDDKGNYAFDRVPSGAFEVVATARGFEPHVVGRKAGATDPVTIELRPGHFVAGLVTGSDGKPMRKFSVHGFRARNDGTMQSAVNTIVTSEDGGFRLSGFLPGRWWVEVRAKGHAPTLRGTGVGPNVPTPQIRIRLGRGKRVCGYVLDEVTGEPLANTRVVLRRPGTKGLPRSYVTQRTTTDDNGYFLAVDLPPHGLVARLESPELLERPAVRIGSPSERPRLLLARRGATLAGRVWDERGEPIANRRVRLLGTVRRDRVTDSEGRFRFSGLQTGQFRVSAKGVTEYVKVQSGFAFRCDLIAGPKTVCTGTVTAGGEPRVGCSIRIEGVANEPAWWTSSDRQGRFTFRSLVPGRYRVVVLNPYGHGVYERMHDFAVGQTETIECRLPAGQVEGLVEASLTARPLPGTRVQLVPQEMLGTRRFPLPRFGSRRLRVKDDGLFRFDGVPPGRYVLLAWKDRYAMERRDDVIIGRDSKIGPLRIALTGGGVLRGTVRVGANATQALVQLLDEHGQTLGTLGATAETRKGEFTFRGLVPGTYTLRVSRLGCFERRQQVTVQPGGNPKLRVVLDQLPQRSSQRSTGVMKSSSAPGR